MALSEREKNRIMQGFYNGCNAARCRARENSAVHAITEAIPNIVNCLEAGSWMVREAAAKALGILGTTKFIDKLQQMTDGDPDADVRDAARMAIQQIRQRYPEPTAETTTEQPMQDAAATTMATA